MTKQLVHKGTSVPVTIGEQVTDFRGDKATITGWQEPYHYGSTGRVHVTDSEDGISASYYPSVFNLEWKELA